MTTRARPAPATVIYDADCGFCRWSLAVFLRTAERGALRPLPLGTPEADRLLLDLSLDERESSWHLVVTEASGAQRFSAGAALAPALARLPRGRRSATLVAHMPRLTERGYRWVAGHRGLLGRFVPERARRWADRVIEAHGGPARP
jgi:predicted DCC family thiol-disulfide oxidoreductase YuxK